MLNSPFLDSQIPKKLEYFEYLHHFIAKVIDHLYCNSTGLRLFKLARRVAVEGGPGFFVNLGLQRRLQRAVRIVGTEEVGVADEEAFFVVVRVDEPAGDAFGAVAADFAGL